MINLEINVHEIYLGCVHVIYRSASTLPVMKNTCEGEFKSAHTWFGLVMSNFETPLTNNRLIPPWQCI